MKTLHFSILIFVISLSRIFGQEYSLYSNDNLIFDSKYLQESIELNIHLPETYDFSSKSVKYPLTIIFDSQHKSTYPHIIRSIDLLTNETQMPETIIIGVPFTMQNRFYFTSDQTKTNDSLSGIERMELFLFSELIPRLKKEFKADDFISIIGHSRTAFLVNYLAYKKSQEINVAVSLSGFHQESPLSIERFHSFLSDSNNFSNKFSYYLVSGNTLEESNYLQQNKKLDSLLRKTTLPAKVKVHFKEQPYANHMTNYWVSVPPILIDAFAEYNAILDTWLHKKLNSTDLEAPVDQYQSDLTNAGERIGSELLPGISHIFSLTSHYKYQSQNYNTALAFIDLGLSYYPEYLDFHFEKLELYTLLNNAEKVASYKSYLLNKVQKSTLIKEEDRSPILEYLNENY